MQYKQAARFVGTWALRGRKLHSGMFRDGTSRHLGRKAILLQRSRAMGVLRRTLHVTVSKKNA